MTNKKVKKVKKVKNQLTLMAKISGITGRDGWRLLSDLLLQRCYVLGPGVDHWRFLQVNSCNSFQFTISQMSQMSQMSQISQSVARGEEGG